MVVAYLITLPLACLFSFSLGLSVAGLVYGIAIGHVIQSLMFWIAVTRQDWNKISEDAAKRI